MISDSKIHPPSYLSPGSRMPLSRNPFFTGRETYLRRLAEALQTGETAAIGQVVAITGQGGIGKTQLAGEFGHRYGKFFTGGVFWLSFADASAIPAEVALCGRPEHLNLFPDFDALDLNSQIRLVLSAWRNDLPRLLIFDNCEQEELLAQWRPSSGGCRLLVVSRREWGSAASGVQSLPLGVLSREESLTLLLKYRPDLAEDEAGLDAIAGELGDLPLALHLAGSFLTTCQPARPGTPAAYLAQLGKKGLAHHLLAGADLTATTTHERHVARSFALSHEQLDAADPTAALAQALLSRAAYFAPDEPIPRQLLLATVKSPEDNTLLAEDALAWLVALGLLKQEEKGTLLLHQLLAVFGQSVADEKAQGAVEKSLLAEAQLVDRSGCPASLLVWQSHLRAVAGAAQARGDEIGADLSNELGYHLRAIGDYAGARAAFERALDIDEVVFGPNHPNVGIRANNLGDILQELGDLKGARAAFERALGILEQVLGPNNTNVAKRVNNLGEILQDLGDLKGARAAFERALGIDEAVFGPDHPKVAIRVNNLGGVLRAMGDLEGAQAAFEQALSIDEAVF
ncbi:MAG: tetratricopeptide repeat protein, partial [bacterium]|nr:tetratricopeptide repeat protein [bacterium]